MKLEDNHPLATGAVADDDITQQSHLSAKVEETQTVLHRIIVHLVANLVVQIVHQPALLDGQNLVERTCDVESDSRHILKALTLVVGQCLNLLLSEVTLVGTTKVELVAILLGMHAA